MQSVPNCDRGRICNGSPKDKSSVRSELYAAVANVIEETINDKQVDSDSTKVTARMMESESSIEKIT